MKGLNSVIRLDLGVLDLTIFLRPVTCSVSNISWLGRRRWRPWSLRPGGSQYAEIFVQHLDFVLGSFSAPGTIFLRRRRHVEGHVAMMSLQDPG